MTVRVKCLKCGKILTYDQQDGTNLVNHLQTSHPELNIDDLLQYTESPAVEDEVEDKNDEMEMEKIEQLLKNSLTRKKKRFPLKIKNLDVSKSFMQITHEMGVLKLHKNKADSAGNSIAESMSSKKSSLNEIGSDPGPSELSLQKAQKDDLDCGDKSRKPPGQVRKSYSHHVKVFVHSNKPRPKYSPSEELNLSITEIKENPTDDGLEN